MTSLSGETVYNYPLTLDGLEPINTISNEILASSLQIDGSNEMRANLTMAGHVLSGLGDGSISSHSCTYGQLTSLSSLSDTLFLKKSGGVLTGTVSSTSVANPLTFANSTGPLTCSLSAGNASVTNACTLQMASNSASTLEFRDNASNVKSQLKYTYGTPGSLALVVAGVTTLSTSNTAVTCNVPVTLNSPATSGTHAVRYDQTLTLDGTHQMQAAINAGGFKVANSAAGSAGSADCATVAQMEAADAVVVASSVQKTGSALTGGLTWSNVGTPILAVNTGGPINVSLSAGTSSVTQTCSMKMASNSQSYTEFTDVAGVTKAWIRYLASGGGSIDLTVANNPMATLTSTAVTLGGTVQLGGNRVTGMGAPTADTDAATRLYVTNADAAVVASSVQKNGSTMSGSLNMGGTNRVTNMAASSVDGDAVRRQELYGVFLPLNGGTMTGPLDMFSQNINGIPDAVSTHQPVSWDQIRANSIVPTAWRSGQMIQRKYLCPSLSNTLTTSSIGAGSDAVLISTTLTVTAYNHVLVRGGFEINSNGSGSDTFRIRFEHQTQTVTFNNVVAPTESFRTRYTLYEYLFLPTLSGTNTITARLYNDSTTGDTITVNTANWIWAVEESQA